MTKPIEARANKILGQLIQDKRLGQYVDGTLPIPNSYYGSGEIKLIVLGQDPTVKIVRSRRAIKTALNLNTKGSVKAYLSAMCNGLDLKLAENVYATNLFKNFFIKPPTTITEIDVFSEFLDFWLPLLKDELEQFPGAPVITLGEPVLTTLVIDNVSNKVRDYWGYTPEWKNGNKKSFYYVKAADNKLDRTIFPFPHQPSLSKEFYKTRLRDYVKFVKSTAFS